MHRSWPFIRTFAHDVYMVYVRSMTRLYYTRRTACCQHPRWRLSRTDTVCTRTYRGKNEHSARCQRHTYRLLGRRYCLTLPKHAALRTSPPPTRRGRLLLDSAARLRTCAYWTVTRNLPTPHYAAYCLFFNVFTVSPYHHLLTAHRAFTWVGAVR